MWNTYNILSSGFSQFRIQGEGLNYYTLYKKHQQ